jgi:hypothetical protein
MDVIRKLARNLSLPLIDHTLFWADRADSFSYWMSNAFHPNEFGHRAFAACLYRELGIFDESSQSCRLHIP